MISDDVTSQDAIVIGDDLVEALGFEPMVHDDASTYSDFPSVALLSTLNPTEPEIQDRSSYEAEAAPEMATGESVEIDESETTTDVVSVRPDGAGSLADNGVIDLSDGGAARRTVFGRFSARQRGSVEAGATETDAAMADDHDTSGHAAGGDGDVHLAEAGVPADDTDASRIERTGAEGHPFESDQEPTAPQPPTMDDLVTFVAVDQAETSGVGEMFEPVEIQRYEFPDLGEPISDELIADELIADELVSLPVIDSPEIGAVGIDLDEIELRSDVPPAARSTGIAPLSFPAEVVLPSSAGAGFGKRRQRLRARKTRRVIRHIDPWSALKFSVIFHLCFFGALLLASVLVWNAAVSAGTIENIESFIRELGDYEKFEIDSNKVFTAAMLIAGMLTLASTIMVVLLTVVFNLISDLVGGIRVTVIEEDTVRVVDPHRTA
ncbi:MAG: DUF3566 domain-containing protein [Actinomycetota bacterium]|nr:DUF3566 domain-containing protein [Actinomycetota bacterium]